jgi:hypothetical protein
MDTAGYENKNECLNEQEKDLILRFVTEFEVLWFVGQPSLRSKSGKLSTLKLGAAFLQRLYSP